MSKKGGISMMTYYNPLTMYRQQQQVTTGSSSLSQHGPNVHNSHQQHTMVTAAAVVAAATVAGGPVENAQQYWYSYPHAHPGPHGGHHQSSTGGQQYLEHGDVLSAWSPHPHPYAHFQYHHQAAAYQQPHHLAQQEHLQNQAHSLHQNEWSSDEGNNPAIGSSEPSPPITVSSISEISSPITPSSSPTNNHSVNTHTNSSRNNNNNSNNNSNNNGNGNNSSGSASTTPSRPQTIRSPYEWMKKPSYQTQPNPACNVAGMNIACPVTVHPDICILDGKTRTKDKYRVVYTDHQRLELEKEFHYSRYITIRRKAELAANLSLSERQVKIWFQNRRAKERKQVKKREELEHKDIKPNEGFSGSMASLAALSGMSGMLGGIIHNSGSPPLNLGPPSHSLTLTHPASTLHPHAHQHAHSHTVLGL